MGNTGHYKQSVPGVKVTATGFNSGADYESKNVIYTWAQFATVQEL